MNLRLKITLFCICSVTACVITVAIVKVVLATSGARFDLSILSLGGVELPVGMPFAFLFNQFPQLIE